VVSYFALDLPIKVPGFGRVLNLGAKPQRAARVASCGGLSSFSASVVVVKLVFRQVGPSSAAFLRLIAKAARLEHQRALLSSILKALSLPIELRSSPLKFITLSRELCYELFTFLSFHHFPFGRLTYTHLPRPRMVRRSLYVIIADAGSMGKRRRVMACSEDGSTDPKGIALRCGQRALDL
jgi:hypothetical protein